MYYDAIAALMEQRQKHEVRITNINREVRELEGKITTRVSERKRELDKITNINDAIQELRAAADRADDEEAKAGS